MENSTVLSCSPKFPYQINDVRTKDLCLKRQLADVVHAILSITLCEFYVKNTLGFNMNILHVVINVDCLPLKF